MIELLLFVALLLAVLLPMFFLAQRHRRLRPKLLLYGLPAVLLVVVMLLGLYANAVKLRQYPDPLYTLAGLPGFCPSLEPSPKGMPQGQLGLTQGLSTGTDCDALAHFEKTYSFALRIARSGFAGEPATIAAYQRGQEAKAFGLRYAYDARLYDSSGTLLGTFNHGLGYFESPAKNLDAVFLSKDETYTLALQMLERPSGVKVCPRQDNQPVMVLGCAVFCGQAPDCYDDNPYTTDTCIYPGTCHSYCKNDTGTKFTTRPAQAEALVKASPEYRECFP
ncbi:MAG: hypothetical protein J4203_07040 [Candidatus Diapherotrites archaeon]|uniref:Uncharacterized protein n=1 Tax=Candidatus Iainarchaeum sp. TaxID=3101447 RepID=A0A8T4LDA4_9ARCH|nr:hypothetical protein [Candidatus Diapherotrites archaeon]